MIYEYTICIHQLLSQYSYHRFLKGLYMHASLNNIYNPNIITFLIAICMNYKIQVRSTTQEEVKCEVFIHIISLKSLSAHLFWESHLHQFSYFIIHSLLFSEVFCPLLSSIFIQLFVSFVLSCYLSILRIIYMNVLGY